MWGADATSTLTTAQGTATIFFAVDHCTAECVGIHAALRGTRFEALEPMRQAGREQFGDYREYLASGRTSNPPGLAQWGDVHFPLASGRRGAMVGTVLKIRKPRTRVRLRPGMIEFIR